MYVFIMLAASKEHDAVNGEPGDLLNYVTPMMLSRRAKRESEHQFSDL